MANVSASTHAADPMAVRDPSWLPPTIAALSKRLADKNLSSDDARLLQRLTYHPRMERVWTTLLRKTRPHDDSSSNYFHPTLLNPIVNAKYLRGRIQKLQSLRSPTKIDLLNIKLLKIDALDADERAKREKEKKPEIYQFEALGRLFRLAFETASQIEPVFAKDIAAAVRRWHKLSVKLRTSAENMGADSDIARRLSRSADECDARIREIAPPVRAEMPTADDPWIILRNRGDARERSLIIDLNLTMRSLFASDLSSTVATIASVALEMEAGFGRDRVRERVKKRAPRAS